MASGVRSLGFAGYGSTVGRRLSPGWWRRESLHPLPPCKDLHISNCLQKNTVHMEADHCRPNGIEELKQRARKALVDSKDLNLVDTLQHLGIAYHFEEEINQLLHQSNLTKCDDDKDLFRTALRFRLLRQAGYDIPQDVFRKFTDREGNYEERLGDDMHGLLSLHEASYLGANGEQLLSRGMLFSKQNLDKFNLGHHALDFPRQRTMARYEAKRYIKMYRSRHGPNSDISELAILDYNKVQRLYRSEIIEFERWWRELGLAKKLSFARDQPLECFLWTVGMFPEPRYSACRVGVAKAVAILTVIDDIYDVYGSLEELVMFTDAIRRWDTDAMENLPEYMKIGYMAIFNTTNEIAVKVLTEHGLYAVPHLRKTWTDLCEAYLVEAKWFRSSRTGPAFEDYMHNAITTGGTYLALVHAFFLIGERVTDESLGVINSCPEIFTTSGRILRLWDDLGTAKAEQERGDDASCISCYRTHNRTSSDNDARNHVRLLIDSSWRDLVRESISTTALPRSIIEASINLARTSQMIYQHGDNDRAPIVDDCIEYVLKKPLHRGYFSKPAVCNPKNIADSNCETAVGWRNNVHTARRL